MGNICCKDDMQFASRNLKPTIVRERTVSIHTQPNVPASTMILPPHLVKADLSNSSLYLSCITKKDGSRNPSNSVDDKENGKSAKSHISPITPYYSNSNGYMTYPICPDDLAVLKTIESNNIREIRENHLGSHRKENGAAYTFGDVSTEGNNRKIESNDLSLDDSEDGFFEAHSFFDNDKENPGWVGLFERGSVLSQKTGSFRGISDHMQSNQKVSNHALWANEIEELSTEVKTANNEEYEGYDKVYEAERAVDGLKIYMKNNVEEGDGKWSCVKAEWKMRCDAESFIRYVNSFEGVSETIKDSQVVEQCETFEDVEDNTFAVYYISSERGAENKDCLFVRSYRQLEEDRWCDIFKSVECKQHPEYEDKKRLYIKCGGHMVSKDDGEGCRVRLYMEVMLGKEGEQSVPVSWAVDEIKYYVGKCCENLN